MEQLFEKPIENDCLVISVVGSGGKTTFIKKLALYYAKHYHVGVVASTKMCLPDSEWQYEGMMPPVFSIDQWKEALEADNSLCFYTDKILPEGKLWGINAEMRSLALKKSQILLVEADGSNRKPLKGWREDEPVIIPETNITVGILPMHCLNCRVDETIIHRLPIFSEITGLAKGDIIHIEAYMKLVTHERGLFHHARGKKILILNHIDNVQVKRQSKEIADYAMAMSVIDEWRLYD